MDKLESLWNIIGNMSIESKILIPNNDVSIAFMRVHMAMAVGERNKKAMSELLVGCIKKWPKLKACPIPKKELIFIVKELENDCWVSK